MENVRSNRRQFIKRLLQLSAVSAGALSLPGCAKVMFDRPAFRISLAQWSLHRRFFRGEAKAIDFARISREKFGIEGVEYVNQFYRDALSDHLLQELATRADGEGVENLLIMVDGEGALGAAKNAQRTQSVENHKKWADAARYLGCHSIRVNAESEGTAQEQMQRAADGLVQLADYCDPLGIDVLVENHGGLSSNARWLGAVIELADHSRVGTLPDFGNFIIDAQTGEEYDRYQGVRELMPYAKAVSAKSLAFDELGRETTIDYEQMMAIVLASGYDGWVGIEYEGERHPEAEGIRLTQALLEQIRTSS